MLAGGYSRRMGRDKAELPLGQRALLDVVLERYGRSAAELRISTRLDGPGRNRNCRLAFDLIPGGGPLVGIASLLQELTTPWLFVVPCDLPFFPANAPEVLLGLAEGRTGVLVRAFDRRQPFPALLHRDLAEELKERIERGERRAVAWFDERAREVEFHRVFPEVDVKRAFCNLNTPEDHARLGPLVDRPRG